MTRDDVLRMALEAGFPLLGPARTEAAMRFADMVMEECAKVCEIAEMYDGDCLKNSDPRKTCAAAIRARKP